MSDSTNKSTGLKYTLKTIQSNVEQYYVDLDNECQNKINEAENLLRSGFKSVRNNEPKSGVAVKVLGYDFDPENDTTQYRHELLYKSLKQFAVSASQGDRFCVGVVNDEEPECIIECSDAEKITLLLRSAYGTVKVEKPKKKLSGDYKYEAQAHIRRLEDDADKVAMPIEPENIFNWPDKIIAAHVFGNYKIIANCDVIKKDELALRHERLSKIYKELSGFAEQNVSLGASDNSNEYIGMLGMVTKGGSSGTTFQSAYSRKSAHIEHLMKQISCELKRLETAIDTNGVGVALMACADDKSVFQALKQIIGSCLENQGFAVTWTDDRDVLALFLQIELACIVQLPFNSYAGFAIEKNLPFSSSDVSAKGIFLGKQLNNGIPVADFSIPELEFNRHAFVCGMTGSGKTNTMLELLNVLRHPVLIIEPVKTEYRMLKGHKKDKDADAFELDVYEMRAGAKNIMRINPFWFPKGADIQFHIDSIKALITSSFSLTAAMPNILEQCLSRVYANFGWNIVNGKNMYSGRMPEDSLYPTFKDLAEEVGIFLDKSSYEGETLATYKGALQTRLQSFTSGSKGVLLNCTEHPDYEKLYRNNSVIELDALPDDSDKAIVMGAIITQYYQFVKQKKVETDELRHIIVIEEAHRLFKNTASDNKNAEHANPQAQMVESLSNMMAEIRAYGEGIIIVDQCPTKVSPDVIRNSNIKIVHRLDMKDDAELVENALLMKQPEYFLPRLTKGEAFIRFEGMRAAALVRVSKFERPKKQPIEDCETHHLTWDYSFVADMFLGDESFKTCIADISEKFLNTMLYDDLNNINEGLANTKKRMEEYLLSYGLGVSDVSFTTNDFNHLLIAGVSDCITKNKQYGMGRFFDLKESIQMMLRNILRLSINHKVMQKEVVLLRNFRTASIEPRLSYINSNDLFNHHDEKHKVLNKTSHTALCREIICKLYDDYKTSYNATCDVVTESQRNEVKDFINAHHHNFFSCYASEELRCQLYKAVWRLVFDLIPQTS